MNPNYDTRCKCGTIAARRQSQKKNENYGRYFFTCANHGRCTFFKWADANTRVTNEQGMQNAWANRNNATTAAPTSTAAQPGAFPNSLMPSNNPSWLQQMQNAPIPPPFCETHQINCKNFEVKKQNNNFGRKFFSCPAERGCFFCWESDWRSHYQNARPPGSAPYIHKGRRYVPSVGPDGMAQGSYPVSLELFANSKHLDQERVLVHLPNNPEIRNEIIYRLSRMEGYKEEGFKQKSVSLPSSLMDTVSEAIRSIPGRTLGIEPVPTKVKQVLDRASVFDEKDDSHVDWSRLPDRLCNALRPFQRVGVTFGVKKDGVLLIADEMGLGKTLQSIAIAYYYNDSWPLLIICPSSLRMNWSAEFEKWLMPHIRPHDMNIIQKSKDLRAGTDRFKITIISYDLATRNIATLKKQKFKFIIADESHYLKAETSQRTKAIIPLMKSAQRRIMITGTPALSRPKELFPQMDALLGGGWLNSFEYKKRYCNAVMGQFGLDDSGSSNLKELNYLLKKTVMIRREKKHVLTELPEKLRVQLTVEISKQHKKNIEKMMKKMDHELEKKNIARTFDEMSMRDQRKNQNWLSMFRQTAEAKISAVKHYITDRLKHAEGPKDKFLIFGHHIVMLDAIEEVAKKELKKGCYIRIDGSTPNHQRQGLVDKFREEDKCQIAILSIQAAGTGLNFTPCSQVVFAELFWTPGALKQAEDRVHRLNQRSDVHITYIIGRHTLDEKLWPLILRKLEVLSKSLDLQEEDKELWKKKKKWGKTSKVIEMLERKDIEKKIEEEDEQRQQAQEHQQLHETNFRPKIQEVKKRKKERTNARSTSMMDISTLLDEHVFLEDGDVLPPNQQRSVFDVLEEKREADAEMKSLSQQDADAMDLLNLDLHNALGDAASSAEITTPRKKRKRSDNLEKLLSGRDTKKRRSTEKEDDSPSPILVESEKKKDKTSTGTTSKKTSKSKKDSRKRTKSPSSKKATTSKRKRSLSKSPKSPKRRQGDLRTMFSKLSQKSKSSPSDSPHNQEPMEVDETLPEPTGHPRGSNKGGDNLEGTVPGKSDAAAQDVIELDDEFKPELSQPDPIPTEMNPMFEQVIDQLVYKGPSHRSASSSRFFQSPKKEMLPEKQPNSSKSQVVRPAAPRVRMEDDTLDFL